MSLHLYVLLVHFNWLFFFSLILCFVLFWFIWFYFILFYFIIILDACLFSHERERRGEVWRKSVCLNGRAGRKVLGIVGREKILIRIYGLKTNLFSISEKGIELCRHVIIHKRIM